MSVKQQKKTSVIEALEGRQLFSVSPVNDVGALAGSGGGQGKVSMNDFHFVMKANQGSPTLAWDGSLALTGAGAGKISMND